MAGWPAGAAAAGMTAPGRSAKAGGQACALETPRSPGRFDAVEGETAGGGAPCMAGTFEEATAGAAVGGTGPGIGIGRPVVIAGRLTAGGGTGWFTTTGRPEAGVG